MSIETVLTERALRLLRDDYSHSDAAISWAIRQSELATTRQFQLAAAGELERDLEPIFAPRELSLGAQEVWA